MSQMSVALGRNLGSFWSMSSICLQVRDGRRKGVIKEDRGRGREERREKRKEGQRGSRMEGGGGGEKRGREGRCLKWERDSPNIKRCKSAIYPPAASVHHCSLPSLAQRKPEGDSWHIRK